MVILRFHGLGCPIWQRKEGFPSMETLLDLPVHLGVGIKLKINSGYAA